MQDLDAEQGVKERATQAYLMIRRGASDEDNAAVRSNTNWHD